MYQYYRRNSDIHAFHMIQSRLGSHLLASGSALFTLARVQRIRNQFPTRLSHKVDTKSAYPAEWPIAFAIIEAQHLLEPIRSQSGHRAPDHAPMTHWRLNLLIIHWSLGYERLYTFPCACNDGDNLQVTRYIICHSHICLGFHLNPPMCHR